MKSKKRQKTASLKDARYKTHWESSFWFSVAVCKKSYFTEMHRGTQRFTERSVFGWQFSEKLYKRLYEVFFTTEV